MANWKHKIEIRGLLDMEPAAAAKALAARLRTLPATYRERRYGGDTLDEMIDQLDEIVDLGNLAEQHDFNDVLRGIYEWADYNRLWLYLTAEAA